MNGYLYLFFEDYLADSGSSYRSIYKQIINTKNEIIDYSISEMKNLKNNSVEFETELENSFNISAKEMNKVVQEILQTSPLHSDRSSGSFSSYDKAIQQCKKAKEDIQNVDNLITESNNILEKLDSFLALASSKAYLDNSLVQNIKKRYTDIKKKEKELEKIQKSINCGTPLTNKDIENLGLIMEYIINSAETTSGLMFELADPVANMFANREGVRHIKEKTHLLHIGSVNTLEKYDYIEDPAFEEEYKKLTKAINENNGTQSKGDLIVYIKDKNIEGKYRSVVFQEKNYSDISKVKAATYTFKQLIEGKPGMLSLEEINKISKNMLVNIAGTLAGKRYRSKIPESRRAHKNVTMLSQNKVDTLWEEIGPTITNLAYADAIAGVTRENITNKVNFYVIRDKSTKKVAVIPTSKILEYYINNLSKRKTNNVGTPNLKHSGKPLTREKYWTINVQNFSTKKVPKEAADERSNAAYTEILKLIYSNKITISINFAAILNQSAKKLTK